MLGEKTGSKLTKYVKDYVVFDLETTGVSSLTDEIVEISGIKVADRQVVDEFSTLVNPGRPIPWAASRVNHITDDMVADAPGISEALRSFWAFVGDEILVGHNIHSFDMKFLYRDTQKYFGRVPDNDYIDTLLLARRFCPQAGNYALANLSVYYGIPVRGAHRALNDCRMNQQVYERLAEAIPSKEEQAAMKTCPRCGEFLIKRNGKYGAFWGCGGFPKCRYTERI